MKVEIGPYPSEDSIFTEQQISVYIDPWDTWSMDYSLAHIILPMLKQLKDTKHGSPIVDDEDVPHLPKQQWSSNESAQYDLFASEEQDQLFWKQSEVRWNWLMDEMIWAFETMMSDDWCGGLQYDRDIHQRVQRGTTLFGKYYRGLWD
jgi:hypothetical protein